MTNMRRKHLTIGVFLASTALGTPAYAQQYTYQIPPVDVPPVHSKVDEFNVDLVTRYIAAQVYGSISIGPSGPGGLKYVWSNSNRAGTDLNVGLTVSGSAYSVYIGAGTTTFTLNGTLGTGTFTNNQGGGETLAYNSSNGQFTFTSSDGAVLVFTSSAGAAPYTPQTLTYPGGEKLTYYSNGVVTSNLGYQFRPTVNTDGTWSKVVLFNMNNETCDPTAASCTLTGSWPTIDFAARTVNGNPAVSWTGSSATWTETIPISSTQNEVRTYGIDTTNNRVTSVTDGNGSWSYSYPGQGATYKTGPSGTQVRVMMWDSTTGLVTGDVLIPGNSVTADNYSFTYDSYQRLLTSARNGVTTTYTYDSRGNVTQTLTKDTANNAATQITTSAVYPASCSNAKTCNKPTSTTDENSKTTSYTYDPNSGNVATVTSPSVTSDGVGTVSPVVTYTYGTQNETWKNGTGGTVTGSPVYRLATASRCMSQATCNSTTNPNDEIRTTFAYDATHGLLPSSVTTGTNASASPVLQATTAYTYTNLGDVETTDGPLSGTADTSWFAYDNDRRLIGTIGPAPGNGQPNRAISVSYTTGGLVDTTSMGTATAQSSSALSGMTVLQKVQSHYNAQGLKDKDTIYNNAGAVAGVTQYGYTTDRFLQCTAVRNNSTTWNSQSNACAQTSTNTDLITKYKKDQLGRLLEVRKGYTSDTQTADQINVWTAGILTSQKDGNGNVTTYSYDTFNRLSSICYPDSTTDCNKITLYDARGNIKTRQLRDGTSINYSYDALNRLTSKALPEGTVSFGYDLLGHLKSLTQGAAVLSYTYDQLGRNLTQSGPQGTVCSTWDIGGRRTQLRYPGSSDCSLTGAFYVNYDYLTTGEIQKIRENGATSGVGVLATYAYDALGNRSSVTYGNGAAQSYGYDPLYRLQTLTSNLEGAATTNDVTNTLGWNPASQLSSLQRSNNNYIWARSAASYSYSANNLNQYTSNGPTSFTYDAKGNLQTSGTTKYCYNSENRLISVGTSANCSATSTLSYDPSGRLLKVVGTLTTQFAYDGLNMIGEYDQSSVLKAKHVFGPGVDEPIVSYDASGNRSFLTPDERGSIVALTNSSGTVTAIDAYDEYGLPKSDASGNNLNAGRFQYTGQSWLNEIGMYYYKNRVYSPVLGRFFQTDQSGYGDGMNWYAYAHNDPVNGSDPMGLEDGLAPGYTWCGSGCTYNPNTGITVTGTRTGGLSSWSNPADGGGTRINCLNGCDMLGMDDGFSFDDGSLSQAAEAAAVAEAMARYRASINPPNAPGCKAAGDSFGSKVADGVGDAHGSIFDGAAASEKIAGRAANAEAISRAAIPGAVVLGGLSEGIGAANDHANGMSWGRAGAIHGTGFAGGYAGGELGASAGFVIGEAIFPAGGGIPGAIIGGIIGAYGGGKAGEKLGTVGADAAGICK